MVKEIPLSVVFMTISTILISASEKGLINGLMCRSSMYMRKYGNYIPEELETPFQDNYVRSTERILTGSKIRHPCSKKYMCCQSDPICKDEEKTCGHGPYIPKSLGKKEKDCHSERPKVTAEIIAVEAEKTCKECDGVFKCAEFEPPCELCPNVFSLWKKRRPLSKTVLEECEMVPNWDACHQIVESCCRCCSCRGCPSCPQDCHPCDFSYGKKYDSCVAIRCGQADEEQNYCKKHPSGCYFVPDRNTELARLK